MGALLLGFKVKLGLVRGKYLSAGLHAAEASYVSSSSISPFRAAIVRAVWSSKMPLANAPAILNLLDGPVGVDRAFHIVWSRFRMMRKYLAYGPDEEPRIFKRLDLISRGSQGHGPVHLRLISAVELGFAWMGRGKGGFGSPSLPPLRMTTGPVQHFYSSILDACRLTVFAKLSGRKGFFGSEYSDFQGSLQLLTSSHPWERDKMLLRAVLCVGVWNGFLLGKAKKEDVPCVYLPASELAFENLVWGTVEEYGDARLERCRAFLPVPGVMQTVQRAEFWGAILAMQAHWPCH